MPFILPARTLDSGYNISNSLRFNDDDSAFLDKTFGSSGNRKTLTISCWIKRATLSTFQTIISACPNGSSTGDDISFQTSDKLMVDLITSNGRYQAQSSAVFRDVSAWYNVVVKIDTTQSSNRMLVYVNNEQVAVNSGGIPQNEDITFSSDTLHNIGRRSVNSGSPADYYMSDFHFIDGSALAPTEFGETNDNGVWIPKKFTGSFGSNGFKLEFLNSGNPGVDTSGNSNTFSVSNMTAQDNTTDTPTNNFATLNSLSNFEGSTLSEGNTKAVTPAGSQNGLVPATMGVQNGKWYWEVKVPTTNFVAVGIIADDKLDKDYLTGANSSTRIVKGDGGTKHSSNSSGGNYMASYEGSILQVALNLDDGEITFGAGGSWANGSGSTNQTFSNSTPAYTDLNSSSDFTNKFILPVVSDENQGTSDTFEMNFGNPPFAISSGNSDGAGFGNFEYAVPSGYFALCTKNLAEYG